MAWIARLLKTGQTTQYSSELDDGHYEKGVAKDYTVMSTGDQAGTSNIDLVHKTAATISFAATTPGTIADSGNDLAMFKTGETIVISGSASNDGVYEVSTGNVAGTIRTTEATVLEAAGATVSIAKREAHSNECVLDNNTGLMWSRYTSAQYATMGSAGTGAMPWTGKLYDIFQYAAAANAASLGGYADWRVPNDTELASLRNMEQPTAIPDAVAFPSWPADYVWSATTPPNYTSDAMLVRFSYGPVVSNTKDNAYYSALVRGGV